MISTKLIERSGKKIVTKELQALIDEAYIKKEDLIILEGTYLVSSLFLKSNMNVIFNDGARLLGTDKDEEYPILPTRFAGIEMDNYVAILNVINCENVTIKGNGIVEGAGKHFWTKYWGEDMKGGMRKEYDAKGLRAFADYDCKRPRNILISNSSNISLNDLTSKNSGFWNVHVLYSHDILVSNVKIESDAINSPSTDGIDIDSCHDILVTNCITNSNDDSICIKSGRDADGVRVGIPCHDITIKDCTIKKGFGITIGSEVSGGIYNINISDIKFINTDCGFRIKSSENRKGYIKDIHINNLDMINVKYAFHIYLNWNPNYNTFTNINDSNIPSHYKKLMKKLEGENTKVSNIYISNVISDISDDYTGISRAFMIEGYMDSLIDNISFNNVKINAFEYGIINFVSNVSMNYVQVSAKKSLNYANDDYDNR